ncbi:Acid trehalase-like protein 1 [Tetrabaena socialis]|uniref:Acid trehalase-like protein 1 n=1 Tax=Tetrabaena socialis TaxID=47790 RepID=A0A2J7ZIP0_9CHLO|nr:Acid trehalase-like protein 1 [Tetrabaena socialis]|eukprot:PNH00128.1 Acid trehalase-like protein 1 [Tetrabaena socialis]
MVQYDGAFTLTVTPGEPEQQSYGPFLSNGKIGITLSADGSDAMDSFITGDFVPRLGTYSNNLVDGFKFIKLSLFEGSSLKTNLTLSLAMDTGIATASYDLTSPANVPWVNVEHDMYVHRAFPFIVVQTMRMKFTQAYLDDDTAPPPTLMHEIVAAASIMDPVYNTNTLAIPKRAPVYLMNGTGSCQVGKVSVAAAYMFDASACSNGGYNVNRADRRRAFNRVDLTAENLVAGATLRVHVVAAMMTSCDFPHPQEEIQRMLLNFLSRPTSTQDTMTAIRAEHVNAWMGMWKTNIIVEPKDGLSAQEEADIMLFRRGLRTALYHIYSSTRHLVNTEFNPMNISVVDRDGSIMYDGDLYFIPTLLLLKPELARNILSHRFKSLSYAQQLAAAYGDRGAKFPYGTDSLGYAESLYWDTVSPVSIFNTPLIAINVWNYYRTTRDFYWLETVGFPILRSVADFVVSVAEPLECTNAFTVRNVTGPAGITGDDNVFTNYMCATALRYAIESAYELNVPTKASWHTVYSGMTIMTLPNSDILKFDAAFTTLTDVPIAEPLILMTPYFDTLYYDLNDARSPSSVDYAASFYASRTSRSDHPYNVISMAIIDAQAAQTFAMDEKIASFYQRMLAFLQNNSDDVWGNLAMTADKSRNNVTLSAMLLNAILIGPLGFKIKGGVSDTRFYYQDMCVDSYETAVLPATWDRVVLTHVGGRAAAIVRNTR